MKTTLELNTAILEIIKPAYNSGLFGLGQSANGTSWPSRSIAKRN